MTISTKDQPKGVWIEYDGTNYPGDDVMVKVRFPDGFVDDVFVPSITWDWAHEVDPDPDLISHFLILPDT